MQDRETSKRPYLHKQWHNRNDQLWGKGQVRVDHEQKESNYLLRKRKCRRK